MTGDWRRLDPRGLAATALALAGVAVVAGVPTVIGIARDASVGAALVWVVPIALAVVVAGVLVDVLRCRRTWFRVTHDRFELETRYVGRRRRGLPRERIRVVDLTADPVSRVLGLVSVRIATGDQGRDPVTLWAVRAEVGAALRDELLGRAPAGADPGLGDRGLLVAGRSGWFGFGVLSFLTPTMAAAAVGAAFTVSGWFDLTDAGLAWLGERADAWSWPLAVLLGLVVLLVVGTLGALALTVEAWWRHRLLREADGMRVTRGLLTTRSISVEERRLRGVELVEPIGARLAGGARVDALVTGTRASDENDRGQDATLLPAAPRAVALGVAAAVLRSPVVETVPLDRHPTAALRRRQGWALGALAAAVLGLLAAGLVAWSPLLIAAPVVALLGGPLAWAGAGAAYRALGHALTDDHLVVRAGVLRRATAVLRRDAVIGWTVRASLTQRRAGLVTLVATTATVAGGCALRDVGEADALALVRAIGGGAVATLFDARDEPSTVPSPVDAGRHRAG